MNLKSASGAGRYAIAAWQASLPSLKLLALAVNALYPRLARSYQDSVDFVTRVRNLRSDIGLFSPRSLFSHRVWRRRRAARNGQPTEIVNDDADATQWARTGR
jgi:hypothetical protein